MPQPHPVLALIEIAQESTKRGRYTQAEVRRSYALIAKLILPHEDEVALLNIMDLPEKKPQP